MSDSDDSFEASITIEAFSINDGDYAVIPPNAYQIFITEYNGTVFEDSATDANPASTSIAPTTDDGCSANNNNNNSNNFTLVCNASTTFDDDNPCFFCGTTAPDDQECCWGDSSLGNYSTRNCGLYRTLQ